MQVRDTEHPCTTNCFLQALGWNDRPQCSDNCATRTSSCINGSWDYPESTSFQPWFTVTPRCCNYQISFDMIGTGLLIQSCPIRLLPEFLDALGVSYPSLKAMMNWEDLHLLRFHFNGYAYHTLCICCIYTTYISGYKENILSKFMWYTI